MEPTRKLPDESFIHRYTVKSTDFPVFEGQTIHEVCSTYTLCREAEYAGRLILLAMKHDEEEGIGTFVHLEHKSPAFLEDELILDAKAISFEKNQLICEVIIKCTDRLIAIASTGQAFLPKNKLRQILTKP